MIRIRMNLLCRVLVAIVLGACLGYVLPVWALALTATFCSLFTRFLTFVIPLIIVAFVVPAIAGIGARAGRMVLVTVVIAYCSSVAAGMLSYFTGAAVFPHILSAGLGGVAAEGGARAVAPLFTLELPPVMGVMTALCLAFVVGMGLAARGGDVLAGAFGQLRGVVVKVIYVVIVPLLPLHIFGTFAMMSHTGEIAGIVSAFTAVIGVIFVLHVLVLVLQFAAAGAVSHRNAWRMLRTMMPAYATALGTSSSAATLPVTLQQVERMGVSQRVAGLVVPLCANIHMSGATLKITACSLALVIMGGMDYGFGTYLGFVMMLCVTMVAAPGVPGGAIFAALGVLQSVLGFSDAQLALMISLHVAMDSFGTACNVTGDGAIAAVVDRWFGAGGGDVEKEMEIRNETNDNA